MVLYEIKNKNKNKNRIKSVSIIKHMLRAACGALLTFAYLCAMLGVLESRTHGVELPEDFRGSFLAQRRVCEHGDVGAFR